MRVWRLACAKVAWQVHLLTGLLHAIQRRWGGGYWAIVVETNGGEFAAKPLQDSHWTHAHLGFGGRACCRVEVFAPDARAAGGAAGAMNKFKAAAQATVNAKKPASSSECVKVVVRCRPLSQKEVDEGRQRIVDMDLSAGQISVRNAKAGAGEPPKVFTFDLVRNPPHRTGPHPVTCSHGFWSLTRGPSLQVYDWNCKQIEVYEESALPIVESTLEGYNGEYHGRALPTERVAPAQPPQVHLARVCSSGADQLPLPDVMLGPVASV